MFRLFKVSIYYFFQLFIKYVWAYFPGVMEYHLLCEHETTRTIYITIYIDILLTLNQQDFLKSFHNLFYKLLLLILYLKWVQLVFLKVCLELCLYNPSIEVL